MERDCWSGPKPLEFSAKVLRLLALWPDDNDGNGRAARKRLLLVLSLCPSASTVVTGAAHRLASGATGNLVTLLDHVVGLGGLIAMVYMGECFARNAYRVQRLVERAVHVSHVFGAQATVSCANRRVERYAKWCLAYGVAGNVCYAVVPLLAVWAGQCKRADALEARRDPCGLIVRVWYPWDVVGTARFLLAYLLQLYTCIVISVGVLALTMAPVGLLANTVALLQDLQAKLRDSCPAGAAPDVVRRNVNMCLQYHSTLIG